MAMNWSLLLLVVLGVAAVSAQSSAESKEYKKNEEYSSYGHDDSGYGYEDHSKVSLRKTTVSQCDAVGLLAAVTYSSGVECNTANGHNYNYGEQSVFMPNLDNRIGNCRWTLSPYLIALIRLVLDGIAAGTPLEALALLLGPTEYPLLLGTYEVKCDFMKGAAECGDGMCDDMILESKGNLWWVKDAAVKTLPLLEGSGLCGRLINLISQNQGLDLGGLGLDLPRAANGTDLTAKLDFSKLIPQDPSPEILGKAKAKLAAKAAAKAAQASTASANYKDTEDITWWAAQVLMANGPVTVKAKHSEVKYDEGHLQANLLYILDDTCVDGPCETTSPQPFYVDPYSYNFKLTKSGHYGKY